MNQSGIRAGLVHGITALALHSDKAGPLVFVLRLWSSAAVKRLCSSVNSAGGMPQAVRRSAVMYSIHLRLYCADFSSKSVDLEIESLGCKPEAALPGVFFGPDGLCVEAYTTYGVQVTETTLYIMGGGGGVKNGKRPRFPARERRQPGLRADGRAESPPGQVKSHNQLKNTGFCRTYPRLRNKWRPPAGADALKFPLNSRAWDNSPAPSVLRPMAGAGNRTSSSLSQNYLTVR
jgi:hypothetical protein